MFAVFYGGLLVLALLVGVLYAMYYAGAFDSRDTDAAPAEDVVVVDNTATASMDVIRPACAVIEDTLLTDIVSDDNTDWRAQASSAQIYTVLAERGCAENAQFFEDMAARKQTISDGLRAISEPDTGIMTSVDYLYSDERICQTIEKRVIQNIDTDAYDYREFLDNANTYSVLYQFGCMPNKKAYARAAIRELGVAMALVPPESMTQNEIVTIMEVYKRLNNADAAHMVLQRLKARGYDMKFLLSMEEIIHGMA